MRTPAKGDSIDTIPADRVKRLLDSGTKLVLVDLQPIKEFQENRLPGARSWPSAELPKVMVWRCAFVLCVLLTLPSTVLPHASLIKSVPARRAQIFKSPPQIQLWFSERLEARFSSLRVIDSTGNRVDLDNVAVDTNDPKRIFVGIKPLVPGQYKIRFRVLSVDGHVVEGDVPFTIRDTQRAP